MAVPNYIKIDVDGIEDKILCGATKTMKDLRVKSICLEMQDYKPDENRLMLEILSSHSFVEPGNFGLNLIFTRL